MNLLALPAFQDNYIWLLHDGRDALVVDPGEAQGVLRVLQMQGLKLGTILVTHHHPDHVGGVSALREASGCKVYGPAREAIPGPFHALQDNDSLTGLGVRWRIIDVPGHTAGHIAYMADDIDGEPLLFCGDTLFSGGCGRLFEGTPAQMLASLDRLAALPADTRVCCAHEYTLANLRFALAVEPGNPELQAYAQACEARRERGEPTLPSRIGTERAINPFLRTREPAVMAAARAREPDARSDAEVFAAVREWKNQFR